MRVEACSQHLWGKPPPRKRLQQAVAEATKRRSFPLGDGAQIPAAFLVASAVNTETGMTTPRHLPVRYSTKLYVRSVVDSQTKTEVSDVSNAVRPPILTSILREKPHLLTSFWVRQ